MNRLTKFFIFWGLVSLPMQGISASLDSVLKGYQAQGAGSFDASKGKAFWEISYNNPKKPQQRSCKSCHGSQLDKPGEHVKSGKTIDPMAPSVNPKRYTDVKKIEKWFKRNCKWTVGRVCTAQEKGDVLTYLNAL